MVPAAIHTSRSNCGVFHSLPGFFHVRNPRGEHFQWLFAFLDHDPKLWRVGELIWTTSHMGSVCLSLGAISDGGLSWLRDCTWLYYIILILYTANWHFLQGSWTSPPVGNPYWPNWYVMEWDVFFLAKYGWNSHNFLVPMFLLRWDEWCKLNYSMGRCVFYYWSHEGLPRSLREVSAFPVWTTPWLLGRVGLRFIITGKILKWSQAAWLRTVPFQLQAGRCSRPQSRNCANDVGFLNSTKDSWCCFGEVSHWGIIY